MWTVPDKQPPARFSPLTAARIAGVLYLIVIVTGIASEIFVRERLIVAYNAAATAENILRHERLFRLGFASDLFGLLCVIPLVLLLYELFEIVNARIALLAVFFSLVGTAVQATALLGHFAPLILLNARHPLHLGPELLQAQTYLALQLQRIGFAVALAFFGGTMLARGYLILHATFFPRFIGALLLIEGMAYLANSFADFVAPGVAPTFFSILMVSGLAEVILCLWLLVNGVNEERWEAQRVRDEQ